MSEAIPPGALLIEQRRLKAEHSRTEPADRSVSHARAVGMVTPPTTGPAQNTTGGLVVNPSDTLVVINDDG